MKKILFGIVPFLLLACSGEQAEENNRGWGRGYTPTVEVIKTLTGALPLEERLTGVVRAKNQIEIFPEITAPITEILVNSGDSVQKGQVLVRLRDSEARERLRQAEAGYAIANAQVAQAEANARQLRSRLDRIASLSSRNLESELELETIQAQVESAQASLQLSKAQKNQAASVVEERRNELANTIIRSPIDGFVGTRQVEVGQNVSPATQLFQVGDTRNMEIRVSLTERMLSYIEVGQTVSITSDNIDTEPVMAQIDRISPFLNPVTNATSAEISVDNSDNRLRAGMFVTVDILYGESEQAVLVPNNAIYNHPSDGRRGVYVASAASFSELDFVDEEERPEIFGPVPVEFIPVEVVAQGRQVSGIRGINSGDYVVTLGQNLLASGRESANVRVIEWDRMIHLQELQSRDLLDMIRKKLANRNGSDGPGV